MAKELGGKTYALVAISSLRAFSDLAVDNDKDETRTMSAPAFDHDFLPPKLYSSVQQPRWKRALWQTSVAIGIIMLWGVFWLLRSSLGGMTTPPSCVDGSLGFLAPDGVYGNFTLGEARAIDMAWNVFIGRGGQAVVGVAAYGVYTDALMRILEVTPVSFEIYAAMAIHPNQVWSILPISKAVWRGIRPRLIMIWILLSCIYLIALPTMVDAMSGYVQRQDAYIQFANETTVPYYYSFANGSTVETLSYFSAGDQSYATICVPTFGFQWGFASVWVLVCLWSFGIWLVGTYVLWLDAQYNSQLRRSGRSMGTFLAAAELSDAMREQLGPHVTVYSDLELRKALTKRQKVKYTAEENPRNGTQVRLSSGQSGKLEMCFGRLYSGVRE